MPNHSYIPIFREKLFSSLPSLKKNTLNLNIRVFLGRANEGIEIPLFALHPFKPLWTFL